MTDDNKHSNKPSSGAASPNDEHLLINQKQIRNALRKIADFSEKDNADALANQQMLLNNQRQVLETTHDVRGCQNELKSSQDHLNTFLIVLEAIISNQDRIQANQKRIIENQMMILKKLDLSTE